MVRSRSENVSSPQSQVLRFSFYTFVGRYYSSLFLPAMIKDFFSHPQEITTFLNQIQRH